MWWLPSLFILGTHGISLLPQDARAALNGIRSETFCSKFYGVHGIWAGPEPGPEPRAAGPGLGPGPDRAWPRAQARAQPK